MSDTMNGQQQIYLSHNFQIRFCDFGLATAFDGKDFRCNKYVGKTGKFIFNLKIYPHRTRINFSEYLPFIINNQPQYAFIICKKLWVNLRYLASLFLL